MHQFPCSFFLKGLEFREDFIFYVLECTEMKFKGRMAYEYREARTSEQAI